MRLQKKKSDTKKEKPWSKDKKKGEKQINISDVSAEENKPSRIKTDEIRLIAEPLCESEGIELVHVEYQREPGGRVLRIYIDKPGGVTLDDCVHISRQISDLLDVCIKMPEIEYSLEVSSPGINRPLGKEKDFEKFKGSPAKIRTVNPIEGQRNFHGVLQGISEGIILIKVNEKIISIPFQDITKARLVNSI